MIRHLFNNLVNRYLLRRYQKIQHFKDHPHAVQSKVLESIIGNATPSLYPSQYGIKPGDNTLPSSLPIVEYNDIETFIIRMLKGESNILTKDTVKWYAKSSGTSSGVSKYIPVSQKHLKQGHYTSSWDMVTVLYHDDDNPPIFAHKNMLIGGSIGPHPDYPMSSVGDISGILVHNFPKVGRPFYTPAFETALIPDWEEKIRNLVEICSREPVITFAGAPNWISIILQQMLDHTGEETMQTVWPNARYYIHGGVNFEPYRSAFDSYFPDKGVRYIEAYNASEGYFAFQDDVTVDGMLLLLDNDIYYEFVHYSEYDSDDRKVLSLREVVVGEHYVMLITSSSGLWRYTPGDVITFVQTAPYRIKVSGRISQYINVFGEEVMVHNTDEAITQTCIKHQVQMRDYTVCPIFANAVGQGGHEWIIEFDENPRDITEFTIDLDTALQAINSDYAAKRYKDLALRSLKVNVVHKGTFNKWLKSKGKQGGQTKVPRLSNERKIVAEVLQMDYHLG